MIINIRGISGSGKTFLARKVMQEYHGTRYPIRAKDGTRKQPIGYLCCRSQQQEGKSLYVVGHYESACGGADTIHGYELLYNMVYQASLEHDVLYEGLLISGDIKQTKALLDRNPPGSMLNVALDVPLEVCMDSVTARRKAAWERKGSKGECPGPMPLHRAQAKQSQLQSAVRRLLAAGIPTVWASRDKALDIITGALQL